MDPLLNCPPTNGYTKQFLVTAVSCPLSDAPTNHDITATTKLLYALDLNKYLLHVGAGVITA
jgi:hypothetical protein